MKQTIYAIAFLVALLGVMSVMIGCNKHYDLKDPMGLAQYNLAQAKQYHELVGEMKTVRAKYDKFVNDWNKACQTISYSIQRDQDGEPACLPVVTPAPPPAPAATQPPAPSSAPKVAAEPKK